MNNHHPEVSALNEILAQGEALISSLNDHTYTAKVPEAFHATLGSHYRHCLDHFRSLFDGIERDLIDYDARKRDPRIETDRHFALNQTRELRELSSRLLSLDLSLPISVRCRISYAQEATPSVHSTLGREIMFCVSHAIHHYALIGMMCALLEVQLPQDFGGFGVAPSTVKHLEESAQQLPLATASA